MATSTRTSSAPGTEKIHPIAEWPLRLLELKVRGSQLPRRLHRRRGVPVLLSFAPKASTPPTLNTPGMAALLEEICGPLAASVLPSPIPAPQRTRAEMIGNVIGVIVFVAAVLFFACLMAIGIAGYRLVSLLLAFAR